MVTWAALEVWWAVCFLGLLRVGLASKTQKRYFEDPVGGKFRKIGQNLWLRRGCLFDL